MSFQEIERDYQEFETLKKSVKLARAKKLLNPSNITTYNLFMKKVEYNKLLKKIVDRAKELMYKK